MFYFAHHRFLVLVGGFKKFYLFHVSCAILVFVDRFPRKEGILIDF